MSDLNGTGFQPSVRLAAELVSAARIEIKFNARKIDANNLVPVTPGFSRVPILVRTASRFNGFSAWDKPLKRLKHWRRICTGLKPGVNEKSLLILRGSISRMIISHRLHDHAGVFILRHAGREQRDDFALFIRVNKRALATAEGFARAVIERNGLGEHRLARHKLIMHAVLGK